MADNIANSTQSSNVQTVGNKTALVTQEMTLRSVDRSKKNVRTWRTSIVAADSVYNPQNAPLQDLMVDIMLDGHLSGIVRKRVASVCNKKLVFKKGEDKRDEFDTLIKSKSFRDCKKEFVLSKFYNVSGLEFVPGPKFAFNRIPRKHIKTKTQKITYEQWDNDNGIFWPDYKNIMVIYEEGDLGLLTICGFYALLKKGAISTWAEYIELFGSPVMIMKYKGHDLQSKKAGDKILEQAGNSMKICLPEEMGFDMKDGKASNGDGQLQEKFIERMNQEMSLAVLGNSETSTNGKGGTGAKTWIHSEEQKQLIKDDMDDLLDILNSDQFLSLLQSYGYDTAGGNFEYVGEVDIDFLQQKMKIDLPLIQAGLPVSAKYLYETYNIPMPEPGEQLVVLGSAQEPDGDETEPDADEKPAPKIPGKQPAKPKPKKTAEPAQMAMTPDQVKMMMQQTLSDFFATALSTEG